MFLKAKYSPIGIDAGSDSLKMLQLETVGDDLRLAAAATYPMPPEAKTDPSLRLACLGDGVRQLLATGDFKGRSAVTCLPGSDVEVFHVRIAPVPEAKLANAIRWEIQRQVQFDAGDAVMRYIKVGDVFQGGEQRWEVIVTISPRATVEGHLNVMQRAKLDIAGVQIGGFALIECFRRLMRRREDSQTCHFFVDIGASYTHAIIAHGTDAVFAKKIPIGGDDFSAAYAQSSGMVASEAKLSRAQLTASVDESSGEPGTQVCEAATAVADAISDEVDRLAKELAMCVRYYGSVFQGRTINRLIFLGGESTHRQTCQRIAKELGIAAQIGDPFTRVLRNSDGIDMCIDRRSPQPAWAVAMGCALVNMNGGS